MARGDGIPDPVDVHVGERLRARRSLLGMTQERLAEAVSLTFQQIQKYERGTNRVSASRLWEFSKVLKVPISYFYEGYSEKGSAPAYGLSDNEQEGFSVDDDLMDKKETIRLVREYYSISDPKLRRDVLKMIKTIAGNSRPEEK